MRTCPPSRMHRYDMRLVLLRIRCVLKGFHGSCSKYLERSRRLHEISPSSENKVSITDSCCAHAVEYKPLCTLNALYKTPSSNTKFQHNSSIVLGCSTSISVPYVMLGLISGVERKFPVFVLFFRVCRVPVRPNSTVAPPPQLTLVLVLSSQQELLSPPWTTVGIFVLRLAAR